MRTKASLTIIAVLAAWLIALAIPNTASAHTITGSQCTVYGVLHKFTTGNSASKAKRRCNARAALHNTAHKCDAVSGMSFANCVALSKAALDMPDVPNSWPYNAALHELLRRESTWSPNAVNDGSGACGLFQRLPCPWKYRAADPERVYATPYVQAKNGYRYILYSVQGYGTPEAALAAHDEQGWY